ncbi:MAG: 4Fe-4S binding protein [Gammaproteobacteria bacterium]|jgi:ferredoxin
MEAKRLQDAGLPAAGSDGQARQQALASLAAHQIEPAPAVRYRSGGRLVIIGRGARALPLARQFEGSLTEMLVIVPSSDAKSAGTLSETVECLAADVVRVDGYLGNFVIELQDNDGVVGLAGLFPTQPPERDLVLDLGDTPLIDRPVLPVGYYHAPAVAPDALARALSEIPGLVGEFDKPQYFRYDSSICAHARSGIRACTRCIDTCPTLAIRSVGERIEVDPYLCQGAGSCATACPSGAITYSYPQPRDTLDQLRLLLRTYREAGGRNAVLLIHARGAGETLVSAIGGDMPENVLPFACEEIGSVGMDTWLAALAYGAVAVVLLAAPQVPVPVGRELDQQAGFAQAILRSMGYAGDAVRLLGETEPQAVIEALRCLDRLPASQPAGFAGLNEKRTVIRMAIDHLHTQSPEPRPLVNLPAGAPFGEVTVDRGRCTLCMACVSQCPGKALLAGDERPQLGFIEENCVQCGLCARSCPENAIAPSPRYLYDRHARNKVRVLHEEEPFLCIRCGKPFATRSTIERITARLGDHPMFQGEALQRVRMCEDCRVIDLMEGQGEGEIFTPGMRS